jgi:hypothetical protein
MAMSASVSDSDKRIQGSPVIFFPDDIRFE